MPTYAIRINGRTASIQSWDPARPLLYALRAALGLTGSKNGCGQGQCGACTVLLDGAPVRACTVAVSAAAGRTVTTIEGLGTPERPDPLQAAFTAEQAAQCGYCTSGMIVAARGLLMRNPAPTEEQVMDALAGNLCRCGAYPRILRAIMRVARPADEPEREDRNP